MFIATSDKIIFPFSNDTPSLAVATKLAEVGNF